MSLVGTVSPPMTCNSCGSEWGSNVAHIGDADFENSHHPDMAYTKYDPGGKLYLCDRCVWDALFTQFGHLLPQEFQRDMLR